MKAHLAHIVSALTNGMLFAGVMLALVVAWLLGLRDVAKELDEANGEERD